MLRLTDEQKRMYEGDYGLGMQKAMTILVKYGNGYDAERMIKVDSVHTPVNFNLEFLSEMLDGVDDVKTLSTLHMTGFPSTRLADKIKSAS